MFPTPNPRNGLIMNLPIKSLIYILLSAASMAKLVRRHTSNVEIIGSNPIGSSVSFCFLTKVYFPHKKEGQSS